MRHSDEVIRQKSGARMQKVLGAAALLLVAASASAAEVRVISGAGQADVSIVRRVNVGYRLVTSRTPLEFEIDGPTWLRVYTRLWWPAGATGTQRYSMTLRQDDAERPLDLEAGLSRSSFGPKQRPVAEWRSFFIEVPAGRVRYRLLLDEAKSETVGVRFAYEQPRPWQAVQLDGRSLTLVEGRDTSRYAELAEGRPLELDVSGPCRVRVRCRLNFVPSMTGFQSFVLAVRTGKTELARGSMRASRSPAAVYANEPSLVPSGERSLRFGLGAGRHRLALELSGTLAGSAGVAVDILPAEKYE